MEQAQQKKEETARPAGAEPEGRPLWRHVEDALRGLRFGTVTLTVQDGVVVQVERTEKIRFSRAGASL